MNTNQLYLPTAKGLAALRSFNDSFEKWYETYMVRAKELSEIEKQYREKLSACKGAYDECNIYAELIAENGGFVGKAIELPEVLTKVWPVTPLNSEVGDSDLEGAVNDGEDDDDDDSGEEQIFRRRRRIGIRSRLVDFVKESGQFLSSKQIIEIVEHKIGGTPSSTITGGLSELTKEGQLKRFPTNDGFMYGLPEWFDGMDPDPSFQAKGVDSQQLEDTDQ